MRVIVNVFFPLCQDEAWRSKRTRAQVPSIKLILFDFRRPHGRKLAISIIDALAIIVKERAEAMLSAASARVNGLPALPHDVHKDHSKHSLPLCKRIHRNRNTRPLRPWHLLPMLVKATSQLHYRSRCSVAGELNPTSPVASDTEFRQCLDASQDCHSCPNIHSKRSSQSRLWSPCRCWAPLSTAFSVPAPPRDVFAAL